MRAFFLPKSTTRTQGNSSAKGTAIEPGSELYDMFGSDSIYLPTEEEVRQATRASVRSRRPKDANDRIAVYKHQVQQWMVPIIKSFNRKLKEFAELAETGAITEDAFTGGPFKVKKVLVDIAREYGIHCMISEGRRGTSEVCIMFLSKCSSAFAATLILLC